MEATEAQTKSSPLDAIKNLFRRLFAIPEIGVLIPLLLFIAFFYGW